ncbi:MAG: hypothetical protein OES09_11465 [Gammaproteobacteria bacterium]|nr:hypothetical protein [Gammaproteobacteria bacterium]
MLNTLQSRLEQIYDIQIDHKVGDYVFSDPVLAKRLDTSVNARQTREKLLVREDGEDLELSLYLAPEIRALLDTGRFPLDPQGSADLCCAIEGVSHFLCLAWNAEHRRSVTLLELELQAEIDKYVTFDELVRPRSYSSLRRWLFERVTYDAALLEHERQRYQDANRYAGKFCGQLAARYLQPDRRRQMLGELRRFYRASQADKLRMIEIAD